MSSKHLFPQAEGLVVKGLRGLIAYNPSLSLIESSKVVYDTTHPKDKVAIISGGGAGHEPAWAGYVGKNMLAASASGDIFASPTTNQIMDAIDAVPSDKGTILVVTNYTGDCLHFGLASEKANNQNKAPCGMIICGDDVSVGRKGGAGRRGLASQIAVLKIMGAASAAGESFDDLMYLGTAVSEQIVSIAATLDHCHVPGRTEHATLEEDEIELGTGPHNEPGYKKISPVPSASDFLSTILNYLLDENDPERGYVHFEPDDELVLCVSNFGGVSPLEQNAIVDELLEQLEVKLKKRIVRVYNGPLETSLNAPAFSVSLINLTRATEKCKYSVKQILDFLEVKTSTQWESMAGHQASNRRPRAEQISTSPKEEEKPIDPAEDLHVDPATMKAMIQQACQALVEAEPDLTKWDTEMGDGDCGETLKSGANGLLSAVNDENITSSGSVVTVLRAVEKVIESKMGGTLGGILGIWFVALTGAVQKAAREKVHTDKSHTALWGVATLVATENLRRYTTAKIGDRTVMDTLIPFSGALAAEGATFDEAVRAAVTGAEQTRKMQPKLGRATYVEEKKGDLPPDPGAAGAMVALMGLLKGLKAS